MRSFKKSCPPQEICLMEIPLWCLRLTRALYELHREASDKDRIFRAPKKIPNPQPGPKSRSAVCGYCVVLALLLCLYRNTSLTRTLLSWISAKSDHGREKKGKKFHD